MLRTAWVWRLRAQVFTAGAVVMGLELVGSRLLAPVFGNSIFVWGSLIGVVLGALSLGYHYGGRVADRGPNLRAFSAIIFGAGLFVLFIPFVAPPTLELALVLGLGERYGPLLATTALLVVPTVLLGMVSPYSIRLATQTVAGVGQTAGNLYALSTIGSIVGTFVTVFVLIPELTVRTILIALGLVLMGIAALGLAWSGRVVFGLAAALLISPVGGLLTAAYVHAGNVIFETETPYNHLDVVQESARDGEAGVRILYLNGLPHSAMYLNGSVEPVFRYTGYFDLALLFKDDARHVLFAGGGGFSGPKKFLTDYPQLTVDVVEIDPEVVATARRYFAVPANPRLTIHEGDVRTFLAQAEHAYDIMVLDAYSKTYVPFHLMTQEFFMEVAKDLTPDGVIVSNLIASVVGDTSDLFRAELRTIRQVFPQVYVFPTSQAGISTVQNIIVIATKSRVFVDKPTLIGRATANPPPHLPDLPEYVAQYYEPEISLEETPILTDDFAPVETMLNPITGRPYDPDEQRRVGPLPLVGVESYAWTLLGLIGVTVLWGLTVRLGQTTDARRMWNA